MNPSRVIGGRYAVLAELGRGGMGIVWRAEDRVMGRQVAVKELHLPAGLTADERRVFRQRLLREARTAGRLNDPGIVTVYDVITEEDPDGVLRDHIVMELIEARSLAEVVSASGPLDEPAAASIGGQLLAALRAAHDGGVVHRDVKPSNVMVAAGGRVKLTDFGIAQAVDDPRLTSTGALVGSPGYISPERLDGGPATPAADLWALGATLFHAVEGRGPFQRDTSAATISAVLSTDAPATRCRGPLGSVIAGLLMRSPQARLTGVQAAALLAAPSTTTSVADVATVAHGATTPLAAAMSAVRRRTWPWVAATAALAVLALVGGLVVGATLLRGPARAVETLTYGPDGTLRAYQVSGDYCLNGQLTAGRVLTSSAVVSCDEPHELEVFETLDPFGTQRELAYPGVAALSAYATAACTLLFDSELIVGADKDRLAVAALVPSAASFAQRSPTSSSFTQRDVVCVLRDADGAGQLTGTRISEDPS